VLAAAGEVQPARPGVDLVPVGIQQRKGAAHGVRVGLIGIGASGARASRPRNSFCSRRNQARQLGALATTSGATPAALADMLLLLVRKYARMWRSVDDVTVRR